MRILETVALTPHSTPPHRVIAMPIIRSFGVRSNVFPVTTRFLPCTSLRSSHTVHAYMSFYHTSHVRFGRNGHMEQRLMGRRVRFTRNGHTEYGFWIANVRFGRIGHVGVRGCVAMRHAKCRTSRRGASGILLRGYSNDRAITCCADDAVAASHHRPIPAPQQPQSCPSHWNRCWR